MQLLGHPDPSWGLFILPRTLPAQKLNLCAGSAAFCLVTQWEGHLFPGLLSGKYMPWADFIRCPVLTTPLGRFVLSPTPATSPAPPFTLLSPPGQDPGSSNSPARTSSSQPTVSLS